MCSSFSACSRYESRALSAGTCRVALCVACNPCMHVPPVLAISSCPPGVTRSSFALCPLAETLCPWRPKSAPNPSAKRTPPPFGDDSPPSRETATSPPCTVQVGATSHRCQLGTNLRPKRETPLRARFLSAAWPKWPRAALANAAPVHVGFGFWPKTARRLRAPTSLVWRCAVDVAHCRCALQVCRSVTWSVAEWP
jgi:hypothetical protein